MSSRQTDPQDSWGEEFEDTVAAALIACYETKVKKHRGAAPSDRLTEERIAVIRQRGPYIPSPSRILNGPQGASDGVWTYDTVNDPLDVDGVVAYRPGPRQLEDLPRDAYLCVHHVKRASALGRYWHAREPGTLFQHLMIDASGSGLNGERRFFTVKRDGGISSCTQRISVQNQFGGRHTSVGQSPKFHRETEVWSSVALQLIADRRFCWSITALEQQAKAHIGCMREEVKSLLYARSIPLTATGRKRPILHLVEAHRRRIRHGVDVDVSAFLRGQQIVEIGSTVFKVLPPSTMQTSVSAGSQHFFNEAV